MSLRGLHHTTRSCLVTAGPTREFIDPVRFITNRSSGKMGYAFAEALKETGWYVTLITGPTSLDPPHVDEVYSIISAEDLYEQLQTCCGSRSYDMLVMAAAVADYTPSSKRDQKLKKETQGDSFNLCLEKTKDIITEIQQKFLGLYCVGFCAETENLLENARIKLKKKGLDCIIANDVSIPGQGFDSDFNSAVLITQCAQEKKYSLMLKKELAREITADITAVYAANHCSK